MLPVAAKARAETRIHDCRDWHYECCNSRASILATPAHSVGDTGTTGLDEVALASSPFSKQSPAKLKWLSVLSLREEPSDSLGLSSSYPKAACRLHADIKKECVCIISRQGCP